MNAAYRKLIPIAFAGHPAGAVTAVRAGPKPTNARAETPELRLSVDETPVARDGRLVGSYSDVIRKVSPSVVRVNVTQRARLASAQMPDLSQVPPQLRRFFGEGMPEEPGRGPRQQGLGSGVIVTPDGYILTNNHVVDGADEVKVALQDGRELDAKVVGRDPKTDVAVLKVDAGELPAIALGDSEAIEVGDVVLAIGNPFGIGQTVTRGIVRATGRATLGLDYEDFIQTDAAINPGNSGGPLVNLRGEVVGINTAIASNSGGSEGIGFAIPIEMVRFVARQLVERGSVDRGFLGVSLDKEFAQPEARRLGMVRPVGARVEGVTRGAPAERAGLRPDDVIIEFAGRAVEDDDHLMSIVSMTPVDSVVTIIVFRERARVEVRLTVASRATFEP